MTIGYVRMMIMPVQEALESGVSVEEHVLLGCFGLDLAAVRQKKQLRLALRRAGYPAALAAQLIRDSPLLVREAGRGYRLRRCDPQCSVCSRRCPFDQVRSLFGLSA
jgi:hypothetical protein